MYHGIPRSVCREAYQFVFHLSAEEACHNYSFAAINSSHVSFLASGDDDTPPWRKCLPRSEVPRVPRTLQQHYK